MCLLDNQGVPIGGGSVATSDKAREILPDCVKPTHYTVNITPNLETCTFKGVVDIE